MLPGNATAPPLPGPPSTFLAGGDSPGVTQGAQAGASLRRGLFSDAVSQGRDPGSSIDQASPQPIINAPSLQQLLMATSVGDDTAAESLPGRVYPSSWDGEPGWMAPGETY